MGRRKMDSELHRIKLETGTVYQTSKGGNYYFRYQINGERKCVSLKTANQEEAIRKARELLPIVQATNSEVIATHVKIARKMAAQIRSLPVSKIWETYANHPNRALPPRFGNSSPTKRRWKSSSVFSVQESRCFRKSRKRM